MARDIDEVFGGGHGLPGAGLPIWKDNTAGDFIQGKVAAVSFVDDTDMKTRAPNGKKKMVLELAPMDGQEAVKVRTSGNAGRAPAARVIVAGGRMWTVNKAAKPLPALAGATILIEMIGFDPRANATDAKLWRVRVKAPTGETGESITETEEQIAASKKAAKKPGGLPDGFEPDVEAPAAKGGK